ncbi:hypothetical protein [Corynebacterium gottingense]|uniref:hypothetical protein n=1 Tax=Corynebacterium gottingense TaxID=2041036 RepID=UPI001FC9AFF4|nr:hypothetical protein [Corynebacterium gottingense]
MRSHGARRGARPTVQEYEGLQRGATPCVEGANAMVGRGPWPGQGVRERKTAPVAVRARPSSSAVT